MVDNKEFDFLGKRGSRPLEVATLRLQNMRQIVTKWNKLAPPDKELITQQGGTIVFDGTEQIYSFKDKASRRGTRPSRADIADYRVCFATLVVARDEPGVLCILVFFV